MNISKYVLLVILLFVVVAVSVAVILHLMNKIDEVEGLYVNTNADLEQVINDKGEQETRIRTLETSNTNLFLKLDTKDSTIERLQSIVKEKTSINKKLQSALIINNEITLLYQDSIKSLITSGDTIVKGDTIYIYPVYKRDLSMYGEWITGSVTMAKKYLGIDINVRSEYEVVIGRERRNIFTEWQSYAK